MGNCNCPYEQQKILRKLPPAINLIQNKIINEQMKESVCKIKCNDGTYGTGFFCKISFLDERKIIKSLISNNHVLNENDIKIRKTIEFYIGDEQIIKKIEIDEDRKTYTSEKYDISIIEIKNNDDLGYISFLEIEDNEIEEIHSPENKLGVYLIHYPLGLNVSFSLGRILNICEDGYTIYHLCETEKGSSGGPIINLNNHKVLGVHKGTQKIHEYNCGTIFKIPIEEFWESINNSFKVYSQKIEYPAPVTEEKLVIIMNQIKNCIIKILKEDGCIGTGFFAYIPVADKKIPALITCNHILDEYCISLNKVIIYRKDNNDIKKIKIDKNRKLYTNRNYDTTIIEIKESDNINFDSFLEIESENLEYIAKEKIPVYLLNYLDGHITYSSGTLRSINKPYFSCNCSSQLGNCGCPILERINNKVIGILIGINRKREPKGVNINYPIKDFILEFEKSI